MSQAMRKLRGIANKTNTTIIFINQIREKIGVMYGSPETTTGGRALKFYSSIRLDIRRREVIKEGSEEIGHNVEIKNLKNKVATPKRTTTLRLIYGQGFDREDDLVNYAVALEVITQKGAWYYFNADRIGQGLANVKDRLAEDEQLRNSILDRLTEVEEQKRKEVDEVA